MANKNVELMRGNPEKAVKTLAIPIMISMLLTASYNIIDGIWVAGLGQAAIAGIGFVTPIFMILNGVSVGLGSGATSSISRFVGAKFLQQSSYSFRNLCFELMVQADKTLPKESNMEPLYSQDLLHSCSVTEEAASFVVKGT